VLAAVKDNASTANRIASQRVHAMRRAQSCQHGGGRWARCEVCRVHVRIADSATGDCLQRN